MVQEADGVYVAEGYDFANIGFIVGRSFVVAIDAGTTEASARTALAALRERTSLPIKYIVLTHAHWDHAGGLAAFREPGSTVIAHAGFPKQLANTRNYPPPFHYFFGSEPNPLDVHPDRLVATRETLVDDDISLELIPAHSGETEDALFIRDPKHDILFVGDAFMPYTGAPFVAEGSAEGYLGAIADVIALSPRRVIHGHPPLTMLYTPAAMPGLETALTALYQHALRAARQARPIADLLHDDYLPDSLRDAPKAVQPYLVVRDTFVQRVYAEHAGYWKSNGDGIEQFTRMEWARALDQLGDHNDEKFANLSDELEQRGDAGLAFQIAELGLTSHPDSKPLQASRAKALTTLRQLNSQVNPFRFIVYSELARRNLAPVMN
jgi:glyoxylase-like metal-dependent hydrolase (beta-lactamase superfamily II)